MQVNTSHEPRKFTVKMKRPIWSHFVLTTHLPLQPFSVDTLFGGIALNHEAESEFQTQHAAPGEAICGPQSEEASWPLENDHLC